MKTFGKNCIRLGIPDIQVGSSGIGLFGGDQYMSPAPRVLAEDFAAHFVQIAV